MRGDAEKRLHRIVSDVLFEYRYATDRFSAFGSAHEGYAVLLEAVNELWEQIKHGTRSLARDDAAQVAAMAIRLIHDCLDHDAETTER